MGDAGGYVTNSRYGLAGTGWAGTVGWLGHGPGVAIGGLRGLSVREDAAAHDVFFPEDGTNRVPGGGRSCGAQGARPGAHGASARLRRVIF